MWGSKRKYHGVHAQRQVVIGSHTASGRMDSLGQWPSSPPSWNRSMLLLNCDWLSCSVSHQSGLVVKNRERGAEQRSEDAQSKKLQQDVGKCLKLTELFLCGGATVSQACVTDKGPSSSSTVAMDLSSLTGCVKDTQNIKAYVLDQLKSQSILSDQKNTQAKATVQERDHDQSWKKIYYLKIEAIHPVFLESNIQIKETCSPLSVDVPLFSQVESAASLKESSCWLHVECAYSGNTC